MDNFSLQKPLNMAPTGIATFAKTDLAPDIYNLNADIAILGAPFDLAIQGRTGCRLGPRGIRLGSTRFTYKKGGTYDSERKEFYMDTDKWKVVDCGDADYIPGDLMGTMANLREAVRIIQSQGTMPVVLGGDCAVDFPMLQGMEGAGKFDIIHIDAHLDWTKPLDGQKYFNGSPMRNAASLPYVGRILHLGIRGIGSSGPEDFAEAREHGDGIYSVRDVRKRASRPSWTNSSRRTKWCSASTSMPWMRCTLRPPVLPCLGASTTTMRWISWKPLPTIRNWWG